MSQTTLPEPQTHTLRTVEDGAPFLVTHTVAILSDEVNPDTLTATTGMAIGALEGAVEAEGMAADWESLKVHTQRRKDLGHLVIQVDVHRLES